MPYKDPEKKRGCKREYDRKRYAADPTFRAKKREYQRERNAKPEQQAKNRERHDLRKYGITRAEMVELLGSDACGICGFNGGRRLNPIDHCAETSLPG